MIVTCQELARMLQEQEGTKQLDMLDQDRLMAIEAQDKELARLLQERVRLIHPTSLLLLTINYCMIIMVPTYEDMYTVFIEVIEEVCFLRFVDGC